MCHRAAPSARTVQRSPRSRSPPDVSPGEGPRTAARKTPAPECSSDSANGSAHTDSPFTDSPRGRRHKLGKEQLTTAGCAFRFPGKRTRPRDQRSLQGFTCARGKLTPRQAGYGRWPKSLLREFASSLTRSDVAIGTRRYPPRSRAPVEWVRLWTTTRGTPARRAVREVRRTGRGRPGQSECPAGRRHWSRSTGCHR
jgi:hypothetical protein